jgi:CBS domain-containing protein
VAVSAAERLRGGRRDGLSAGLRDYLSFFRYHLDGGYRHLPIVDQERIVGIVSHGDFNGLERARLGDDTGCWEIL